MTGWRVLLAEDEPLMAQMLMDILAELPVEVVLARDGREALTRTQEQVPDLLLLDAMMPEMDGFEVAKEVKADPRTRDVPIIFLTARSTAEDRVRGLELGAEDYVVKPVRRDEFLARIKNILRRGDVRRAAVPAGAALMRGRLEILRLASLLPVLEGDTRTGTLHLESKGRRGQLMLQQGRVAFAVEGPRVGEAAVYSLLAWEQGEFELEDTSGVGPEAARVTRPTAELLAEGRRRAGEVAALRKEVAALDGPVRISPAFREALLARPLAGALAHVMGAADGTRTVAEMVQALSLDEWELLTALQRLMRAGILEHGPAVKRGSPRLGMQVQAEFQSLKAARTGRTLDISARGVFLRTTEVFPVGEELLLRFSLPGLPAPFKATGRVVWSSPTDTPQGLPAGMGVQFTDLSAQEQELVERYVVERLVDRALGERAEAPE